MDWDDAFSGEEYFFGTEPAAFLPRVGHLIPDHARLLFLADGEGRNSVWAARQGHVVTAIEQTDHGIAKARALARRHGVTITQQQDDITRIDWNDRREQFDAIIGIFIQVLGADGRRALHRDMRVAIRPGGLVMLHGYAPRQVDYGTGGPPHRENMYELAELRADFPGWQVLVAEDRDREARSGRGHDGRSALVDFVARKPA